MNLIKHFRLYIKSIKSEELKTHACFKREGKKMRELTETIFRR